MGSGEDNPVDDVGVQAQAAGGGEVHLPCRRFDHPHLGVGRQIHQVLDRPELSQVPAGVLAGEGTAAGNPVNGTLTDEFQECPAHRLPAQPEFGGEIGLGG